MTSTTIQITLPRPHRAQRLILRETKRYNVVACGRRFGKTKFGIIRAIPWALKGYPVGWFAPNYKYVEEVWSEMAAILRPAGVRVRQQQRRLELPRTGGHIEFWTLDKGDAGRSREYKHVVVDEAAKVADLGKAWFAAIRPTLAIHRGTADFLSTPRGRDFFWEVFCRGQSDDWPAWKSWRMPSLANPIVRPAEIEDARRETPERLFGQEFEADFILDSGGVFRKVDEAIDRGRRADEPRAEGRRYHMGADLARVEDFTVLTVLDGTGRQVYHERFNQVSWERAEERTAAVAKQYDATLNLDSTGVGDPIFERLRKRGVRVNGYTFTNQSKEALMDNLAILLENAGLRLMDVPQQEAELLSYQYEITPSRNVRMNAPPGQHDDCVCSLALAAWGLSNRRPIQVL